MEINFLQRLFCCFPRMQSIRLAAYRRRPVCGRQWRIQLAILQSAFANRSLRVTRREDGNPSGPAGQLPLHKGAFFYSHQRFFFVSAEKCLSDKMSKFRYWVQGQWPCWGLRGRSPSWFPTLQREIVCPKRQAASATGCRDNVPAGKCLAGCVAFPAKIAYDKSVSFYQ